MRSASVCRSLDARTRCAVSSACLRPADLKTRGFHRKQRHVSGIHPIHMERSNSAERHTETALDLSLFFKVSNLDEKTPFEILQNAPLHTVAPKARSHSPVATSTLALSSNAGAHCDCIATAKVCERERGRVCIHTEGEREGAPLRDARLAQTVGRLSSKATGLVEEVERARKLPRQFVVLCFGNQHLQLPRRSLFSPGQKVRSVP